MADILVRGLDDEVVNRLKQRAALTGRSLQSETKIILERAAGRTLDESLAVAATWRERLGQRRPIALTTNARTASDEQHRGRRQCPHQALHQRESAHSEPSRPSENAGLLLAPDLLFAETANILWKYVRRSELSQRTLINSWATSCRCRSAITSSSDLVEIALRIAIETDRTVYDSLYVALAIQSAAVLITADERLVNALAATPVHHLRPAHPKK